MGFRIESSLTNLNGKPSLAPPPIVVVRNCCFRNTFSSKLTFYPLLLTYLSIRDYFSRRFGYPSTPILGDHRYLFFGSIIGFHFFGPSLFRIRWSQSFHRLCTFISGKLNSVAWAWYYYSTAWLGRQDVDYGRENQNWSGLISEEGEQDQRIFRLDQRALRAVNPSCLWFLPPTFPMEAVLPKVYLSFCHFRLLPFLLWCRGHKNWNA